MGLEKKLFMCMYVCTCIHYLQVLCTHVHYLSICMHCLCVYMHMCALFMCMCAHVCGARGWCQVTSLISFLDVICWLGAYCWMQRPSSCLVWLAGLHWGRSWGREDDLTLCLCFLSLETIDRLPYLAFPVCSRDLNSGPYPCAVNSLSLESAFQPS